MGYIPDWYLIMRSADRLHCKPWELDGTDVSGGVPYRYFAQGITATHAENESKRQLQERAQRQRAALT